MLIVIHGTDIVASRKYFMDEKHRHPEAISLDADSVNLTDLAQIVEGGGLFGEAKYIFIEQFLTKRKKSGDYKDIIAYLDTHADDHTIVLWENKELDIATQKGFKKATFRPFKLPQTLFAMLDNIKPGNGKLLIKQFHETTESAEVEMIFFMLVRQFRMLLALQPTSSLRGETTKQSHNGGDRHAFQARDDENPIDEIKKLTWQKAKMQKQAALFETEQLLSLYDKLYEIEQGQKTGKLATPISTAIDFFLLEV